MVEDKNIGLLDYVRGFVRVGDLSWMLRPQQQEIYDWIHSHRQMISVIHAARGYGKTFLALVIALEQALKKPNQRILYACPTREQARQIAVPTMQILQAILSGWVEIKPQATGHQYALANGSVIILEGADDDRGNHLRGPGANLIICDEAGFWRHCDYVVRSVLLPQAQRWGGRLVVLSTSPESTGHDFVGLCERAIRSGSYLRRTIDDNKHLTEKEKHDFIQELGGINSTATKRELYCEFVVEESRAVVPEFHEDRCTQDKAESVPIWRDRYVAMDLGFKDWTHAVFGYWDFQNARLVVEDEVVESYATTTDIVAKVKAKEAELWGDKPVYLRVADNDPQILHDMGSLGLPFSATMKTDKEAAINSLRTMFAHNKIVINKKCTALIHQLKVGIWNTRRTDYERIPGAGHLDGVDALVYLNRMLDRAHNPQPAQYGYQVDTHFVPPKTKERNKKYAGLIQAIGRKPV